MNQIPLIVWIGIFGCMLYNFWGVVSYVGLKRSPKSTAGKFVLSFVALSKEFRHTLAINDSLATEPITVHYQSRLDALKRDLRRAFVVDQVFKFIACILAGFIAIDFPMPSAMFLFTTLGAIYIEYVNFTQQAEYGLHDGVTDVRDVPLSHSVWPALHSVLRVAWIIYFAVAYLAL